MRRYITFVFFLQALFASSQPGSKGVILVLNIGGSNAVGRADGDPQCEVTVPTGVYEFKPSANNLVPLADPVGEGQSVATVRSLNPMLGKRLKELTGYDIIILPCAFGNTNIEYYHKDGGYYPFILQKWNQLKAYCSNNNIPIVHQFAHWLQGENDAGYLETDGYYVELNDLVNNLIQDFNIERVFATRIGYDPNYTTAANSEKIMQAQKLLNFNNPYFILATNAADTFTLTNGKLKTDVVHYTLLGQNEIGDAVASAMNYYLITGNKIVLSEPVTSLQNVTDGSIDLISNWIFNFSGTIAEANNHLSTKFQNRSGQITLPNYDAEGLVLDGNSALLTSRPFPDSTFTIEIRMKMNITSGWTTVLGTKDMQGGYYNKLQIAFGQGYCIIDFGTNKSVSEFSLDPSFDPSVYHTYKITQDNGLLQFYIDGLQIGTDKISYGSFKLSWIGSGNAAASTDMNGTIDWFQIRNTVDQPTVLAVKFTLLNAQCFNNGKTKLNWSVAQSTDTKMFLIERSSDGKNWNKAGVVQVFGNNKQNNFSFVDSFGASFYRIVEYNNENKTTLSQVIATKCEKKETFFVYPNPIKNLLTINISAIQAAHAKLLLVNSAGALIKSFEIEILEGVNQFQLNLSDLPHGVYNLNAYWNNTLRNVEIIKN